MRIEELANLNPWWKFGKEFWKYDRKFAEVKNFVEYKRKNIVAKPNNIFLIKGLRQVGKTIYFKQKILELLESGVDKENILYVSCDRLFSRKELRNIVLDFLKTRVKNCYLFLDEITYLKDWNIELKLIADSINFKRVCIFATGSNPAKLREKVERLPGRNLNEYFMFPLTFREFLIQVLRNLQRFEGAREYFGEEFFNSFKKLCNVLENTEIDLEMDSDEIYKKVEKVMPFKSEIDFLFRIYFLTNGFPYSINSYLRNILNGKEYIEQRFYEDVLRLIFGDLTKIERSEEIGKEIMRCFIEKLGSRYSYNSLGLETGYSHLTVMDYINCFESGNLAYVLHSFDFSKKKIKTKSEKKFYFSTHFLLNALNSFFSGLDGFEISKENYVKNFDKICENIVFTNLMQTKWVPYSREWKTFLFFYYDQSREIDFVYRKNNGKFLGIEVKMKEEVRKIKEIENVGKYLVITKNDFLIKDNKLFVPVSLFLSCLKRSEFVL